MTTLTHQPFAETPEIDKLQKDFTMNLLPEERLVSALVGTGILMIVAGRHPIGKWLLALVGAALVRRGLSGNCPWYAHLGVDPRHGRNGPV